MKLEERPSTKQAAEDELLLDLSELRVDRESPSSFNKSMDFARHTKRAPTRKPPSRNCSKDSMDSFLGDSFLGDDSFAVHEDDHPNSALDDLLCHQQPLPPPNSTSFNKSMDLARHSPTKRSASARVMLHRAHSKDHDGSILGASCTSTCIMGESFLTMEDSFANASFAYGDNDHPADDNSYYLQSSPVKRSERPDLETVLDLEENNECLLVLDLEDDDESSGEE